MCFKNDLILANYSIPFCNRENFNKFWNTIVKSISQDGYFVGNFFGVNDSWHGNKINMTFLEKEEVKKLFTNFTTISFKEIEKDGITGMNKKKHWHIFEIIAKKN